MYSGRWVWSIFLVLAFLAFSSPSWAQGKQSHQRDRETWGYETDKHPGDQPPGWDKGKKTGWHGDDQPPGQEKKYRQSHHHKSRHDRKQSDFQRPPAHPEDGQQKGDFQKPPAPPEGDRQQ